MALALVNEPIRALIYTRVSQDRAGGRSPAEQEDEARQQCEREGWDVVEVVTDSVGASRHSKGMRKGWERAQQILRSGDVHVLVTWAASRAQRDLEAYAELRRLCVDVGVQWCYSGRLYNMDDHDDRFRTGLDALLAEREADEIAFNVKRAITANAVKGRPHGRRLYGYQRVYDPTSGALIGQEPHPTEAAIVRRVFADYLGGKGVRTIAKDLNDEGITTANVIKHTCTTDCRDARHPGVPFARWSDTTVHGILTNPAYIAQRVHRGEVIGDANWPALIEPERFTKVQARLVAKRTSQTRQRGTARLLSGVARCGLCLAADPPRRGKVGAIHDRNKRKVYVCKDRYEVTRDAAKLDAYVIVRLLKRLAQDDVADTLTGTEPAEVTAARTAAAELRERLDEAIDQFTAGKLSAKVLSKVEAELEPKIKAAEATARRGAIPLEIDVPPADQLDAWWDGLTPEQQREVIGAVIEQVVIHPVGKGKGRGQPLDESAIDVKFR